LKQSRIEILIIVLANRVEDYGCELNLEAQCKMLPKLRPTG